MKQVIAVRAATGPLHSLLEDIIADGVADCIAMNAPDTLANGMALDCGVALTV
jgi:hypothetical protein